MFCCDDASWLQPGPPAGRYTGRGFTLVELLVVVAIIMILAGLLMPALSRIRIRGFRTVCQNNVGSIAEQAYAYAVDGSWHRQGVSSTLPSIDVSSSWGDMEDGNPGCLWLLATGRGPDYNDTDYVPRKVWVPLKAFLCPEAELRRNFREPKIKDEQFKCDPDSSLSYSYITMVNYSQEPISSLSTDLVIVADQNIRCEFDTENIKSYQQVWEDQDGDGEMDEDEVNSKNHNREGQNVGKLDGSSIWIERPNELDDDIYSSKGNESAGERGNKNDSFLIP